MTEPKEITVYLIRRTRFKEKYSILTLKDNEGIATEREYEEININTLEGLNKFLELRNEIMNVDQNGKIIAKAFRIFECPKTLELHSKESKTRITFQYEEDKDLILNAEENLNKYKTEKAINNFYREYKEGIIAEYENSVRIINKNLNDLEKKTKLKLEAASRLEKEEIEKLIGKKANGYVEESKLQKDINKLKLEILENNSIENTSNYEFARESNDSNVKVYKRR